MSTLGSWDNAKSITLSNSVVISPPLGAIFVGTGGDVKVRLKASGADVTLLGIPTGATLNIRVDKVYSTGTSASNIVGMW